MQSDDKIMGNDKASAQRLMKSAVSEEEKGKYNQTYYAPFSLFLHHKYQLAASCVDI